ncbi:MAG TPA: amino acid ABC transporter permease [Actinomycetaceae bacterium]|nr:amino acid ABC transporter permease [Actinomycetaceae bacterium]
MNTAVLFDAPGPKTRRRIVLMNIIGGVAVLGLLVVVFIALEDRGQLTAAKWRPFIGADVWRYYLLPGLIATITAAALSMVLANVFGLIFGVGRLSSNRVIRFLSGVVVEFFRAVPVLVMMIFFYFLYSRSGVIHPADAPFWAVVTGLTLYNGSVIAELIRSGVVNLPSGQSEAGLSIGLSQRQTLSSILLPQALIAMMPSMVSQLVVILKDTALGYLITYSELLRQSRLVGTAYQNLLPALMVVAVVFIAINFALSRLADRLALKLTSRTSIEIADLDPADEGRAPMLGSIHTGPIDPSTVHHRPHPTTTARELP